MDLNWIPAAVCSVSLLALIRVIFIFAPYPRGKTAASFAITGFIGFFSSLPFAFYQPLQEAYLPVPAAFFALFVLGAAGCLIYDVNPFTRSQLFAKTGKRHADVSGAPEEEPMGEAFSKQDAPDKIEVQSLKVSLSEIAGQFRFMDSHFYAIQNARMKDGSQFLSFPFLTVSPNGIFHIHPCNWTGRVRFSENAAIHSHKTAYDAKDPIPGFEQQTAFVERILRAAGTRGVSVTPVICVTNRSASFSGMPEGYAAVHIDELSQFLKTATRASMTNSETYDIKRVFETLCVK